jgi:hypothetical protein
LHRYWLKALQDSRSEGLFLLQEPKGSATFPVAIQRARNVPFRYFSPGENAPYSSLFLGAMFIWFVYLNKNFIFAKCLKHFI